MNEWINNSRNKCIFTLDFEDNAPSDSLQFHLGDIDGGFISPQQCLQQCAPKGGELQSSYREVKGTMDVQLLLPLSRRGCEVGRWLLEDCLALLCQLLHPHQRWAEINPPLMSPDETEGSRWVHCSENRSLLILNHWQWLVQTSVPVKAVDPVTPLQPIRL